jgi:hypothetical protein
MLAHMERKPDVSSTAPAEPDIDECGVDRAQIRAMLLLTPEERLKRVQAFVESALEIRELNEQGPVR